MIDRATTFLEHSHPPGVPRSPVRSLWERLAQTMATYWTTAVLSATGVLHEGPLFLMDYLLRLIRVAVLLSIWRTILSGRAPVEGFSTEAVLTYTLIAEAFSEPLSCRTELAWDLWQGTIAARFLRPIGLVGQFAAESAGRWAFNFAAFSIPLLLIAPFLGVRVWPVSPLAGLAFGPSLVLSVAVGLALEFIFGAFSVVFEQNVYVVDLLRGGVTALLSGVLIPLALLPWGIGQVFAWLPFAAMAAAPLQIYTGVGPPGTLLAVQAGWAAILWLIANGLWRWHRERLVLYGG